MDIFTLLIIGHLVGTVLGVGGATFIEIFLTKSLRDGEIDPIESSFLKTTFMVVRVGLIISLFTGFGFLLFYQLTGQTFKLYNPMLWAKMTIIIIIAINAILLQSHKISLWWGSTFSFVSWYSAAIIGVFLRGPVSYSYIEVMFFYAIAVLVGGLALDFVRRLFGVRI